MALELKPLLSVSLQPKIYISLYLGSLDLKGYIYFI